MKNKETDWYKTILADAQRKVSSLRVYGERECKHKLSIEKHLAKELSELKKKHNVFRKEVLEKQKELDAVKGCKDQFPMGCTFDWPTDEAIDMENPIGKYAKDKKKKEEEEEISRLNEVVNEVYTDFENTSGILSQDIFVLRELLRTNDPKYQLLKAVEEFSELTTALLQYITKDGGKTTRQDVIDEIGDAKIRLKILEAVFSEKEVHERYMFKINKFARYIREGLYKGKI